MANPFVTGPVPVYVGVGAGASASDNAPYFLGWFERGLNDFHIDPKYMPINADILGPMLPYDHLFMGEDGWCSGDLSVWNEAVYARCVTRPTHLSAGARGTYTPTDLGSLMVAEGLTYPVWLPFPYSAKTVAMPGQPAGYHFPNSWMFGPDHIIGGLQQAKRRVVFYFQAKRDSSSGVITLYDHVVTVNSVNLATAIPPSAAAGV